MSCHAQSKRERPRVEVNSSDVLEIVGSERTVQELDAVSDENSRRKLQNVVVNSSSLLSILVYVNRPLPPAAAWPPQRPEIASKGTGSALALAQHIAVQLTVEWWASRRLPSTVQIQLPATRRCGLIEV